MEGGPGEKVMARIKEIRMSGLNNIIKIMHMSLDLANGSFGSNSIRVKFGSGKV